MVSLAVATGTELAVEGAPVVALGVEDAATFALPEVKIAAEAADKAAKALIAKGVKPESQLLRRFKDAAAGWSFAQMTSGKKENDKSDKKENDKTDFENPPTTTDKTGSPSDTPIIEKTVKAGSQDKSPLKMALAIVLIIIVIAIIAAVTKARSGFIITFGAVTGATVLLTLATYILL